MREAAIAIAFLERGYVVQKRIFDCVEACSRVVHGRDEGGAQERPLVC